MFAGMAFVVKQDKASDPVEVGFFRPFGILQNPQDIPDLLKQFWLTGLRMFFH
jgi:hypothetical protein